MAALSASHGSEAAAGFMPLMTAYLTETINPAELSGAMAMGSSPPPSSTPPARPPTPMPGCATSQHPAGPGDGGRIGMPLLIHGEVTDPAVDIFDREAVFIEQQLIPLLARHPGLKVVFEHITTADAADFVARGQNLAATMRITCTSTATPSFKGACGRTSTACRSPNRAASPRPT